MKKAMMAIVAAVMMSASALAQDAQQQRPQPRMDRGEAAKQRTEQMVKDYALSEEQAQKLLDLNTEYAEKIPMMMGRGPRGGQPGQRPVAGERPAQRPDTSAWRASAHELRGNAEEHGSLQYGASENYDV